MIVILGLDISYNPMLIGQLTKIRSQLQRLLSLACQKNLPFQSRDTMVPNTGYKDDGCNSTSRIVYYLPDASSWMENGDTYLICSLYSKLLGFSMRTKYDNMFTGRKLFPLSFYVQFESYSNPSLTYWNQYSTLSLSLWCLHMRSDYNIQPQCHWLRARERQKQLTHPPRDDSTVNCSSTSQQEDRFYQVEWKAFWIET